jgi:hypothetical protein
MGCLIYAYSDDQSFAFVKISSVKLSILKTRCTHPFFEIRHSGSLLNEGVTALSCSPQLVSLVEFRRERRNEGEGERKR